jgi:hypothetical protein
MLQREDMIELNGMLMTGPGLETNEQAFSFIMKINSLLCKSTGKAKKTQYQQGEVIASSCPFQL